MFLDASMVRATTNTGMPSEVMGDVRPSLKNCSLSLASRLREMFLLPASKCGLGGFMGLRGRGLQRER